MTPQPPQTRPPRRRFPLMPLAFGIALLLILVDYGFLRSDVEKLKAELASVPRDAPTAKDMQDLAKKASDLVDELDAVKTDLAETRGKVEELEAKIEENEDSLRTLRAERDAAQRAATPAKRR